MTDATEPIALVSDARIPYLAVWGPVVPAQNDDRLRGVLEAAFPVTVDDIYNCEAFAMKGPRQRVVCLFPGSLVALVVFVQSGQVRDPLSLRDIESDLMEGRQQIDQALAGVGRFTPENRALSFTMKASN